MSIGQSGFLLLDVLVAFMIGALAIGVLYEAALTGLYSTAIASHYEQALSRARSRIAIAAARLSSTQTALRSTKWNCRSTPFIPTQTAPSPIPQE